MKENLKIMALALLAVGIATRVAPIARIVFNAQPATT